MMWDTIRATLQMIGAVTVCTVFGIGIGKMLGWLQYRASVWRTRGWRKPAPRRSLSLTDTINCRCRATFNMIDDGE